MFGIIEVCGEFSQVYLKYVEDRSANSLLPILVDVCRPGTIIVSDEWAAYRRIESIGFEYQTVNHSLHFIDRETNVHTQNIESFWGR